MFVPNSYAGAPAKWYEPIQITYFYSGQVGNRVAFGVTGNIDFGDCAIHSEFVLDKANPYFKSMYSIILSGYLTGKTLGLYTNGVCSGTGLMVTDVRMH